MAADISQDPLTSLFKDGISEDLYKLLWSKDELNFGPNINIPDTIVYKYGQPTCWYFTAKNGRVKRKNKHNLMSAKIEEVFNKHVLGYDVLAYFITVPNDHDPNSAASQTTIEYLDRTALNEFLYNHKKEVNGFLQRFIEPKTTHNEIIRSIWSPKVCLLERAENIHQLHDHRYGLYERCVIYEGPEYYFTSAPLRGPVLSGQIQKLSETIVSHIGEVTFGQKQITRIVLNFKVDSRDKIWLLYSTSIRCQDMLEYTSAATSAAHKLDRTLVNIDSVISLSHNVSLNPMKSYEKIVPKARVRCLSCCKDCLEDQRHPVTYKTIVKHYDHVMHLLTTPTSTHGSFGGHADVRARTPATVISWPPDKEIVEAAGGVGFALLYVDDDGEPLNAAKLEHLIRMKNVKDLHIPPMIHNMHAKLTSKSYQRCKADPLFLYKTMHVCEPCYLVYAEFSSMLLRMGQDLTKLLTPDPFLATHSVSLQDKSLSTRPSSADWRAISTANGGSMTADSHMGGSRGGFRPSANHRHAKSSAIGLRTSEGISQPTMPSTIRHASSEGELNKTYSYYSSGGGGMEDPSRMGTRGSTGDLHHQHQHPLEFGGSTISSANGGGLYNADEIKNMIADRERHFFKEISLNPQLKDQHPLMHLISAQQKLKLVDQQSGVLTSKAASNTESVFGTKYGRQKDDTFQKYNIYGQELPYAINGEIVLPSKFRARKKEEQVAKKVARQKSLRSLLGKSLEEEGNEEPAAESEEIQAAILHATENAKANQSSKPFVAKTASSTAGTASSTVGGVIVDPKATQASQKHREFLSNALQHIEADLDNAVGYVGKYSGPTESETPTPQTSSRLSNAGGAHGRRKAPKGSLAPLQSSQSSSKLTLANMEQVGRSNTAESGLTAGSTAAPSSTAPSSTAPSTSAAPSTAPAASETSSTKQQQQQTPKKSTAPTATAAKETPTKSPTKAKAAGSATKKAGGGAAAAVAGASPKGKQSTNTKPPPRAGSLLESSSLGGNSTESALMQKWGIQVEGSVDSLTKAEEMRNIMESSNEMLDRKSSLDDAGSVGEHSTGSESALLRQWGLDAGGSLLSQEVEMDKQRVQEESNSLLMGEAFMTPSVVSNSEEAGGGASSAVSSKKMNRDVIESMSTKLISAMLQDATLRASSR